MDLTLLDRRYGDSTYRNYKYNRLASPSTSPEEWRSIYGDRVSQFERRFELEMMPSILEQE